MGKATFRLLTKELDLEVIDGKLSAFAKVPYAIQVLASKPIAKDGYGIARIDGQTVPKGETFRMDVIKPMYALLIPAGSVARDFDREYTLTLSGFRAEDGTEFKETSLRFRTLPRRKAEARFAAHDEIALQTAREGIVLLKNEEQVLPLARQETLNLFGAGVRMFRTSPTGASAINPRWQADLLQGIQEHSKMQINQEVCALYEALQDTVPSRELLLRAKDKSDTAIIVISRTSGEFLDNKPVKGGYYLTDDEEEMIKAVTTVFDKTVAILNTGYPISMEWIEKYQMKAVIYAGFAGMLAGYALAEILDGRCNPSGKLPDTWSVDYYDNPSAHNFINLKEGDSVPGEKDCGVLLYYEEDIYVGYRYFDSFRKQTAFCFGHGLSYTDFEIQVCEARKEETSGKKLTFAVCVQVTNTGRKSGKEVVQAYVHAPEGRLEKPFRTLAAFEKTGELKPGEKQEMLLRFDESVFASFDEKAGEYILEPGEYTVYVGNSLDESRTAGTFSVGERRTVKKVHPIAQPVEKFHRITRESPEPVGLSKTVPLENRVPIAAKKPAYEPKGLKKYRGKRITWRQVKENGNLLEKFVSQFSDKELCRMNVCGGSNWYLPWQNGEAGKTNVIRRYKTPRFLVSDGNTGLNIKTPNIGFPSSVVLCASFNKELAFEVGKTIAEEARENHIFLNLAPAMNIHRNILNGRHPEYFSEDPFLAGTMAGYQGKGLAENGVMCCYKHLLCNNSDTSRKGSHSIVSERALREIYMKVFEVAVGIQMPDTFMTSYNCVNGMYPAENADILQTLLRDEWGFQGFIMTDWNTYDTVDPVEMAKAGNCWLTEGSRKYVKILYQAVKNGRLSRAVLEQNVCYIFRVMRRASE